MKNIGKTSASMHRVGDRIRQLREYSGMSQGELGDAIGVDATRIVQYELGYRRPKFDRVEAIARVLGVSPYAILDPDVYEEESLPYLLYELEHKWGFVPVIEKGQVHLVYAIPHQSIKLQEFLTSWAKERKVFEKKLAKTPVEKAHDLAVGYFKIKSKLANLLRRT